MPRDRCHERSRWRHREFLPRGDADGSVRRAGHLATVIATFREGYKVLRELGCSDEALVHEMWLSKEPAEVFEKAADDGFIRQLVHHSTVR